MKVHVTRFKVIYETGEVKPEGGIIYDLDNEEQKKHYIEDMCRLEKGYVYQILDEREVNYEAQKQNTKKTR